MRLLDQPIPPRPAEFTPHGAPPGVAVDFEAFRWDDRSPWWQHRPEIDPRLQLIHTNGASREGSLQSQINWGNSGIRSRTHPHYAVNEPQPTKLVPSDRKGIGNYRVSDWSIVIETADAGYPDPGQDGGFLYDHADVVAAIIAYEAITHAIPLQYPTAWDGAGTGCHTEPFGYPYWTNARWKVCPGATKKQQVRSEILPRAQQIRAAWTQPEEDDMKAARVRFNGTPRQFVIRPVVSQEQLDVEGLRDSPIVTANISSAERQAIESEFGPLD